MNKPFFDNMFRLIIILLLVIVVFQSAALFYSSPEDSSLRQELNNIKTELENVRQLTSNVDSLEKDVTSLKNTLSRSRLSPSPIFPAQLPLDKGSSDDPFLGSKDASVLVLYFTDYQCSPCRQFYQSSFQKLKQEFIATNKIKFVLRDFPLNTNKYSTESATLANCAGEQGQYWEMHNVIFENQPLVDSGQFSELGTKLKNLDSKKLDQCFKSTRYNKEISKDSAEATQLGIVGTPSFFISKNNGTNSLEGTVIRGNQPYAVIKEQILKYF